MKVETFFYSKNQWHNTPDFAALDSPQTLVLAFFSPSFGENPEPLKELSQFFPSSIVIGCSTSGEILGTTIHDESICVSVARFEHANLKMVATDIENPDHSYEVGRDLSKALNAEDLKGAIILSDGLNANGTSLIAGFNQNIDPSQVHIAGGLAGDGNRFKSTWILDQNKIRNNLVIAVGLYGDNLLISSSSRGGWNQFGPERLVTKSHGNVVYEIDERPALALYKEYLGEKSKDLPASGLLFPLQMRSTADEEIRLVRTILAVNEENQSITFAGDVPEGFYVQLMKANFDRLIDGAYQAGEATVEYLNENSNKDELEIARSNSLNLAVTCVGRRLVLGERAEEELDALQEAFGGQSNIIGFYSYGELAAEIHGHPCELHNQSMTVMTINELKRDLFKKAV